MRLSGFDGERFGLAAAIGGEAWRVALEHVAGSTPWRIEGALSTDRHLRDVMPAEVKRAGAITVVVRAR